MITHIFVKRSPDIFCGTGKMSGLLNVTRNELTQQINCLLLREYPLMKDLFENLFNLLSEDELPLLIGDDFPDWVHEQVERRLKDKLPK